jgi:hypothetical protein
VKHIFNYISFFGLLLLFPAVSSQELYVSGVVTDVNNTPLPGVTVLEKGTTNGVITNLEGIYQIKVNSDTSRLEFSFVGMQSQEILGSRPNRD